jgi:hypothetical protein
MTIQLISEGDIPAITEAVNAFRYGPEYPGLPEGVRAKIDAARAEVSPVAKICATAETLWAARAALGPAGRTLGVQTASFALAHGWWGLADDARGLRIAQALRKDNGETVSGYSASNDPAPKPEYVVADAEPEPEPEPGEEP